MPIHIPLAVNLSTIPRIKTTTSKYYPGATADQVLHEQKSKSSFYSMYNPLFRTYMSKGVRRVQWAFFSLNNGKNAKKRQKTLKFYPPHYSGMPSIAVPNPLVTTYRY